VFTSQPHKRHVNEEAIGNGHMWYRNVSLIMVYNLE
jgi:hypothetical protein